MWIVCSKITHFHIWRGVGKYTRTNFKSYRFILKKANEKITKCTTNDPFVVHLYHKVGNLYHKSGAFYYINVPQIGGGEKMYHIGALVGEKAEFRGHTTSLN